MEASYLYLALSLVILLTLAAIMFFVKKKHTGEGLSKLSGIALSFMLAGIVFSEDRWVGYSLIGMGVLLAVADMVQTLRRKKHEEE